MLKEIVMTLALLLEVSWGLNAGCKWSQHPKSALAGYNRKNIATTVERCKAACESETTFVCRSFDYFTSKLKDNKCFLNDADTYVAPLDPRDYYTYYEIVCDDDPRNRAGCPTIGPFSGLAISENNLITIKNIDRSECDRRCRSEKTFHCKSYDFNRQKKTCLLQIVDRDDVALSSWPAWDYYEITCEAQGCADGTWQGPVINMAIPANNLGSLTTTLEGCKQACQNEIKFKCRSIDFQTSTGVCYLQAVTSTDVALATFEGYHYYELSGCNGGAVTTLRPQMCYCIGDPHCFSFDGMHSDFMGTCKYTFARDNCKNGLPDGKPSWEVIINSDRNYPSDAVSRVREVQVVLDDYNLVIDLYTGLRVSINGVPALGFPQHPHDDVVIIRTWSSVYVTVTKGIQVSWDGNARVQVSAPEDMKEKMCGLCGDANGSGGNDWTIGDSNVCMDAFPNAEPGKTTSNVNEFGFSWTHSIDQREPSCKNSCPNPPEPGECSTIQQQKAEEHCAVLTDTNGPFKDCLAMMDDAQKEDLKKNCEYDACHLNNYETVICDHGASMAKICQGAYDVIVTWRSDNLCPMECGEGMEYQACGSVCMPTCSDPEGKKCGDTDACEEGCFCKEGMVYDGAGACYSDDKCGCKVPEQNNVYINVGQSFLGEDCKKHCVCEEAEGELKCTTNTCGTNKECGLKDGIRACYCNAPYVSDGAECIELVSPCDANEETKLQCFTCDSNTDSACESSGSMKTCSESNGICEYIVQTDKTGKVTKVKRGCTSRASCSHESLGPDGQDCEDSTSGQTCTQCDYGEQDKQHVCLEPVPEDTNVCVLLADEGSGSDSITRWFYRPDKKKCTEFIYKGTGGNGNNFTSKKKCEKECGNKNIPEECQLPPVAGDGDNFTIRFYFDVQKNKCKKFNYSGNGGNGNNFMSKEDCSKFCKGK